MNAGPNPQARTDAETPDESPLQDPVKVLQDFDQKVVIAYLKKGKSMSEQESLEDLQKNIADLATIEQNNGILDADLDGFDFSPESIKKIDTVYAYLTASIAYEIAIRKNEYLQNPAGFIANLQDQGPTGLGENQTKALEYLKQARSREESLAKILVSFWKLNVAASAALFAAEIGEKDAQVVAEQKTEEAMEGFLSEPKEKLGEIWGAVKEFWGKRTPQQKTALILGSAFVIGTALYMIGKQSESSSEGDGENSWGARILKWLGFGAVGTGLGLGAFSLLLSGSPKKLLEYCTDNWDTMPEWQKKLIPEGIRKRIAQLQALKQRVDQGIEAGKEALGQAGKAAGEALDTAKTKATDVLGEERIAQIQENARKLRRTIVEEGIEIPGDIASRIPGVEAGEKIKIPGMESALADLEDREFTQKMLKLAEDKGIVDIKEWAKGIGLTGAMLGGPFVLFWMLKGGGLTKIALAFAKAPFLIIKGGAIASMKLFSILTSKWGLLSIALGIGGYIGFKNKENIAIFLSAKNVEFVEFQKEFFDSAEAKEYFDKKMLALRNIWINTPFADAWTYLEENLTWANIKQKGIAAVKNPENAALIGVPILFLSYIIGKQIFPALQKSFSKQGIKAAGYGMAALWAYEKGKKYHIFDRSSENPIMGIGLAINQTFGIFKDDFEKLNLPDVRFHQFATRIIPLELEEFLAMSGTFIEGAVLEPEEASEVIAMLSHLQTELQGVKDSEEKTGLEEALMKLIKILQTQTMDNGEQQGFSRLIWRHITFLSEALGMNPKVTMIDGPKPYMLRIGNKFELALEHDPMPYEITPEKWEIKATEATIDGLETLRRKLIAANAKMRVFHKSENPRQTDAYLQIAEMIQMTETQSFRELPWEDLKEKLQKLGLSLEIQELYIIVSGPNVDDIEVGISPNAEADDLEYAVTYFQKELVSSFFITTTEEIHGMNKRAAWMLYKTMPDGSEAQAHCRLLLESEGGFVTDIAWWVELYRLVLDMDGFEGQIAITGTSLILATTAGNIILAPITDYWSAPVQALCALTGLSESKFQENFAIPAGAGAGAGMMHYLKIRRVQGRENFQLTSALGNSAKRALFTATKPFNLHLGYKVANNFKEWASLKRSNVGGKATRLGSRLLPTFLGENVKKWLLQKRFQNAVNNLEFWKKIGVQTEAEKWLFESQRTAQLYARAVVRGEWKALDHSEQLDRGLKELKKLKQFAHIDDETLKLKRLDLIHDTKEAIQDSRKVFQRSREFFGKIRRAVAGKLPQMEKGAEQAKRLAFLRKIPRIGAGITVIAGALGIMGATAEESEALRKVEYARVGTDTGIIGAELAAAAAAASAGVPVKLGIGITISAKIAAFLGVAAPIAAATPIAYMAHGVFESLRESKKQAEDWARENEILSLCHELTTTVDELSAADSYRAFFTTATAPGILDEKEETRKKIWHALLSKDSDNSEEIKRRFVYISTKRLPGLYTENISHILLLLRESKIYDTNGNKRREAMQKATAEQKERTNRTPEENSALVYALYEAAKIMGYDSGGTLEELKLFFSKEHKGQRGIYWNGEQWVVNESGYEFDDKMGNDDFTIEKIIDCFERKPNDIFERRNQGVIDSVLWGVHKKVADKKLREGALKVAGAMKNGLKKYQQLQLETLQKAA